MEFDIAIKSLNEILREKQPKEFNGLWIKTNATNAYKYLSKNIKTENDDIDWDRVTSYLERRFQRRWAEVIPKTTLESYENQLEVDRILTKYGDKLYTFIVPQNEDDKRIQHLMIVSLVRIGQKGNTIAQNELLKWIKFITDEWIDNYSQVRRWQGYPDEVEGIIRNCVRRYRYTGSFLTYLFRTFEYSARGKPPIYSLDKPMFDGKRTRIDYVLTYEK